MGYRNGCSNTGGKEGAMNALCFILVAITVVFGAFFVWLCGRDNKA
jgi:hypothetical protein